MNLNVLAQITIEDRYAKRDINKKIWADLDECENLAPVLKLLRKHVIDYKATYSKWWYSKQSRIITLTEFNDTEDIMTYIAVAVMKSGAQAVPIHGCVEYVARRLEGFQDHMDAVRTASELLAVGALSDLYDTIAAKDSETGSLMIRSRWVLEPETEQYIADTMYLPPLIAKPHEITSNKDSGYFNPVAESVILKAHNHHSGTVALDALNIANEIPFELDEFILNTFEESPNKELDTLEKVKNFQLLKNSSKKVYELLLQHGNKFWFSWRFDKRGRMYSQGYHVNIQSTEYKKALISLSEKQHVRVERSVLTTN